jgi:Flp pilus assembly protein TadG
LAGASFHVHLEGAGGSEGFAVKSFRGAKDVMRERCACAGASRWGEGEEGAALVEMALSVTMFATVLIGVVYFIFGLYTYTFVADAAREASRYASTRGSQSCLNTPTLSDCNANQTEIQTRVLSMRYPGLGASNLNVNTTWLQANTTGATGWTACGGQCNAPGNMVQVRVAYAMNVPLWGRTRIDVGSTSQMVISQ